MSVVREPGGGRRLHISHRTGYRYSGLVDASFNEVRMTPLHRDGQALLSQIIAELAGLPFDEFAQRAKETQEAQLARHRITRPSAPPPPPSPRPDQN